MLKIYIVRHGQNTDNVSGILNGHRNEPLTTLGESQAEATAHHLKLLEVQFDEVYSSPLIRAYDTATIITNTLELDKPVILEDLIERDFGDMTGKPITSIKELCSPDVIETDTATYFLKAPHAETFPDLITRARKLLTWIQEQHTDGSVLLVTHADIGKMLYATYYNTPWEHVLTSFHFHNADVLLLAPDIDKDGHHVVRHPHTTM